MMNRLACRLIRFYQEITRDSRPSCRFHPSCSSYGLTVFEQHQFHCALFLTGRRIARCHPWQPHGVDLPPEIGCGPCICKVR